MNANISKINAEIAPLRTAIVEHKVYESIKTIEDLRIFMEYHIFAVWDFMSLLKSLQQSLTCTAVPWFPKENATISHLINEIVVGEESDEAPDGSRMSHFELYRAAMNQSHANYQLFDQFADLVKKGNKIETALDQANVPNEIAAFVNNTFETIDMHKDHVTAAVFTFGREDLIPNMFHQIVAELYAQNANDIALFKYYLDRHIELDGDHHSNLAIAMTIALCGDDATHWEAALTSVKAALSNRVLLWDGAYNAIIAQQK